MWYGRGVIRLTGSNKRVIGSAFSFHRTKTLLKRKLDILHGLKFKSQALYMYIGNQDGGHGITLSLYTQHVLYLFYLLRLVHLIASSKVFFAPGD